MKLYAIISQRRGDTAMCYLVSFYREGGIEHEYIKNNLDVGSIYLDGWNDSFCESRSSNDYAIAVLGVLVSSWNICNFCMLTDHLQN